MTHPILIGTGFYATAEAYAERYRFYKQVWLPNTENAFKGIPHYTRVIDNSETGGTGGLRIHNNLGHSGNQSIHGNRLMGWSMSWIIPALIAYSEGCDFVYKEQDCLAFGDWLPVIRQGQISYGRNSVMPCEQSLFYIGRDSIPAFVSAYTAIPQQDNFITPEDKMVRASENFVTHRFDMPFGRERPLTIYKDRPWYAQRITAEELAAIRAAGFI